MARSIVSASVEVYQRIKADLLPTPSKIHYSFNIRDLSKVFQGVITSDCFLFVHKITLSFSYCKATKEQLFHGMQ